MLQFLMYFNTISMLRRKLYSFSLQQSLTCKVLLANLLEIKTIFARINFYISYLLVLIHPHFPCNFQIFLGLEIWALIMSAKSQKHSLSEDYSYETMK